MSNNVQKRKEISVLVEQAFPSCILVSFQQGERTFRGVLLDESSQTVIRSSPSGGLGKVDTTANLGLTTARATTCQSNEQNSSTSRVSTRSSTMILRDGKGDSLGKITDPVDEIRGIVECLHQQQEKIAPTTRSRNPSSSTMGPSQNQKQNVKRKQLLPHHNKGDVTNSLKRKRDCKPIQSQESFFKTPKVRNKEDTKASNSLSPKKFKNSKEMELGKLSESSLSIQWSPQSPIFPVLKLKRTSENDNSYVAVTAFSSQSGQLKEVHGAEKSEPISDETTAKKLSDVHHHNTRFKARQGAENCQSSLESEINLDKTEQPENFQNEDAFKSTQVSSAISMKYELNGSNSKHSMFAISQRSSEAESQLNAPKKFKNVKVGDIVWGKVHGHPWWPGQVLHISCKTSESDGGYQIVKVSWYGSTTTSDIPCSSLLMFEENFKHMYKRKKQGAYRLAVRQAQQDLEVCMNGTEVLPA